MNKKILISFIVITTLVISGLVLYKNDGDADFTIQTSGKNIIISNQKWLKSENSENYAKNFEAKEKTDKEAFPQMVTIYLNTMTSDRMLGTKISDNEYLEIFVVHPQTVTIQIRRNNGNYWLLSRQTFFVNESSLTNINPELSEQNLSMYRSFFQNEIDKTRYVLASEF